MHYTKIQDVKLKKFISDCIFIVDNFCNDSYRHYISYRDSIIEIEREEGEKLTITVHYQTDDGKPISNPAITIWDDGEIIRSHGDWRRIEDYPAQLIKSLSLQKKLDNNLEEKNTKLKNKI